MLDRKIVKQRESQAALWLSSLCSGVDAGRQCNKNRWDGLIDRDTPIQSCCCRLALGTSDAGHTAESLRSNR